MLDEIREYYVRALQMQEITLLYSQPWWLDATCGDGQWNVYEFKNSDAAGIALLPFLSTTIRGLKAMITPPMTQWLPLIKTTVSPDRPLQPINELRDQYSIVDVSIKPDPVIEPDTSKFRINLKYSYITEGRLEHVLSKYNENLRRNLREAQEKFVITESADLDAFIQLCQTTYRQRKTKPPSWILDVLPNAYHALIKHGKGNLKFAMFDHQPVAAILTGWDDSACYYLAGGRIADPSGASAHALLLDDAIKHAVERKLSFDFEGSMHPGIANFFQSFGATPYAFWRIREYQGLGRLWSLFHK